MSSLGDRLREEREKRGTSLEEVAQETRIRVEFLAALESGELAELPGGAFNKGFVRSYALNLGLDPDPLVRAYEKEEETQTLDGRLPARPDVLDELRQSVAGQSGGRLAEMVRRHGATIATIGGIAVLAGLAIAAWRVLPRLSAPDEAPAAMASQVEDIGSKAQDVAKSSGGAAEEQRVALDVAAGGDEAGTEAAAEPETETWVVDTAKAVAPEPAPSPPVDEAGSREPGRTPEAPVETKKAAASETKKTVVEPVAKVAESTPPVVETLKTPAAAPATRLTVSESGLGVAIANRELVGVSSQFQEGESVYFWTRIVGGEPGDEIRHVWLRNGKAKGLVELPVNAWHWRTHSRFDLAPGSAGAWAVEARDSDGNVLARTEFVCE